MKIRIAAIGKEFFATIKQVMYLGLNSHLCEVLLELPYLTFLDLSGNDFKQSHIPEFIGSLSNLKYLDLYRAKLTSA